MWELDHKEGWVPKDWCFQTVVLEKTLESPLDCKDIKPVNPKGNQAWIFTGMTDAEAEAPILPSPDVKSRLTEKDSDAGKHRGRRRGWQRMAEVGWHHWLNGHEFELTPGDREDREAWHAAVHGVTKSQTRVSDWTTIIIHITHQERSSGPKCSLVPLKKNPKDSQALPLSGGNYKETSHDLYSVRLFLT